MSTSASFPRAILWSAGALIGLVLFLVFQQTQAGAEPLALSTTQQQLKRELYFADRQDGLVEVRVRSSEGAWLAQSTLEPGGDGFTRSMIRGLVRERRAKQLGPAHPFELIRYADGALVLRDPLTQRQILLQAFGSTNAHSFARYMTEVSAAERL